MPNEIKNATALDLGGWGGSGAFAADETTLGAPGRVVVAGAGTVGAPIFQLNGATSVWVQGFYRGGSIAVDWTTNAGAAVSTTPLPLLAAAKGEPTRGIPSTYSFAGARLTPPPTATRGQLIVAGPNARLLKPYARLGGQRPVGGWRPGYHDNPDLNLPAWPDIPLPQMGAFSATPTGARIGFESDSRVPVTTEVTGGSWQEVRATVNLDMVERDLLQQFFDSRLQPFWYVRPDTAQVCRAWWLDDGDPSDNGLGRGRTTSYGLLLEPA